MSLADVDSVPAPAPAGRPWALWRRQALGVLRIELRRILRSKRTLPVYLLAMVPATILLLVRMNLSPEELANLGHAQEIFANIFQGLILLTVIFFGSLLVFMNLFRGEVIDRSLHYYLLSPLRREVLVVGKYLAGMVVGAVVFASCAAAAYLVLFSRFGGFELWSASSLRILATYIGIAALGTLGYGALFLVLGLVFRNPVFPGLVLYAWEWANFLLPPALKKISVVHYLKSLCPVAVSEGPFAMIAEPARPFGSIVGLALFTSALLVLAGWLIRRVEVTYGED